MEGGEEKGRQRERSWSRTASSQLQQRGPADLDPGWAGDDISKAIKGDDSRQAGSDWQG